MCAVTRGRIAILVGLVLLAAVGVAGDAGWRWWHNQAPYGPQQMAARASLEFGTYEQARAALGPQTNAPYPGPGDQLVLGRVSWQTEKTRIHGGEFAIVLVDKRSSLKPEVFGVTAGSGRVGIGADSSLQTPLSTTRGCTGRATAGSAGRVDQRGQRGVCVAGRVAGDLRGAVPPVYGSRCRRTSSWRPHR